MADLSEARRKEVFSMQTTGNQLWFDVEGYTIPTGVSEATQVTGVAQKLRSDTGSYMAKALTGMKSEAVTGAGATAVYAVTLSTGAFVKDIDAPGSLSFISSKNAVAWAAHPTVATGTAILLDNYAHSDTLGNAEWADTFDHERLETRFNFAFSALIGVAGVGTTTFSETMKRVPLMKGGSSLAKFKVEYTQAGVKKYITVADNGTTLTDTGTLASTITVLWDTGSVSIVFVSPPDAGSLVKVFYCQDFIKTPENPATNAINSATGAIALELNVGTTGTNNPAYFVMSPTQDEAVMGFEVFSGFHMVNKEGFGVNLRSISNNTEDLYSETFTTYPTEGDNLSFSFYGRNVQGPHKLTVSAITDAGVIVPILPANINFVYGGVLDTGVVDFLLSSDMERYAVGLLITGMANIYALKFSVTSLTAGTTVGSRQVFVTGFHVSLGDVLVPYTPSPYVYYMPRPNDANPQGKVNQIYTAKGDGTYKWQDLGDVVAAAGAGVISIESGGQQVSTARQFLAPALKTDDTGVDGLGVVGNVGTGTHTFTLTDVSSATAITGTKRGLISRTRYENFKEVYDGTLHAGTHWLPATDSLQSLGDATHKWNADLNNLKVVRLFDGATSVTMLQLLQLNDIVTTSTIQAQINTKQATITGAATTITSSNLTANKALISDASGKVAVSSVSNVELGWLTGANQYLASTSSPTFANVTGTTLISAPTITGTSKVTTPLIEPVGAATDITIGKAGGTVTLLGTVYATISGGSSLALTSNGTVIPITWSTLTGNVLRYTLQYKAGNDVMEMLKGTTVITTWGASSVVFAGKLAMGSLGLAVNSAEVLQRNASNEITTTTITGTTNQITVTTSLGAITLSLPQDIGTTAEPTFFSTYINNILYASTINERGLDTGVTIDGVLIKDGLVDGQDISARINQDVKTTSTPTFAGIITAGNVDGVDVSAFKTDYDAKVNQDVRTTALPTFTRGSAITQTFNPAAAQDIQSAQKRTGLSCDGVSDYAISAATANFNIGTGDFALAFTMSTNTDSPPEDKLLCVLNGNESQSGIRQKAGGLSIWISQGAEFVNSGLSLVKNQVHTCVLIRHGGFIWLYLDGRKSTPVASVAVSIGTTPTLSVSYSGAVTAWQGSIYRAGLFNYALDESKIRRYSAGERLDWEDLNGSMSTAVTTTDVNSIVAGGTESSVADGGLGRNVYQIVTTATLVYCYVPSSVIGKRYRMKFKAKGIAGGVGKSFVQNIADQADFVSVLNPVLTSDWQDYILELTALTVTGILLKLSSTANGDGFQLDSFSYDVLGALAAYEGENLLPSAGIWPDSSGNANDLTITGATTINSQDSLELKDRLIVGGVAQVGNLTSAGFTHDIYGGASAGSLSNVLRLTQLGTGAASTGLLLAGRNTDAGISDYARVSSLIENATAGSHAGALKFWTALSGTLTERMAISSAGRVTIQSAEPSTSSTDGALVVAGGAGVVGALNVGGVASVVGRSITFGGTAIPSPDINYYHLGHKGASSLYGTGFNYFINVAGAYSTNAGWKAARAGYVGIATGVYEVSSATSTAFFISKIWNGSSYSPSADGALSTSTPLLSVSAEGNTTISGYTKLGTSSPAIKTKTASGAFSGTGYTVNITLTGIAGSKILSIVGRLDDGSYTAIPNSLYSIYWSPAADSVVSITRSAGQYVIDVDLYITYEA